MALSIRNQRAEELAREVAAQTGETMTDAVIHALEDRLQRLSGRRVAPDQAEEILAVSDRCRVLPDLDVRSADEILGYDDAGQPS